MMKIKNILQEAIEKITIEQSRVIDNKKSDYFAGLDTARIILIELLENYKTDNE